MQARTDPTRQLATSLRALGRRKPAAHVALLARRPHYGEELAEFLSAASGHDQPSRQGAPRRGPRRRAARTTLRPAARRRRRHRGRDPARCSMPTSPIGCASPTEEELSARVLRKHVDESDRLTETPDGASGPSGRAALDRPPARVGSALPRTRTAHDAAGGRGRSRRHPRGPARPGLAQTLGPGLAPGRGGRRAVIRISSSASSRRSGRSLPTRTTANGCPDSPSSRCGDRRR